MSQSRECSRDDNRTEVIPETSHATSSLCRSDPLRDHAAVLEYRSLDREFLRRPAGNNAFVNLRCPVDARGVLRPPQVNSAAALLSIEGLHVATPKPVPTDSALVRPPAGGAAVGATRLVLSSKRSSRRDGRPSTCVSGRQSPLPHLTSQSRLAPGHPKGRRIPHPPERCPAPSSPQPGSVCQWMIRESARLLLPSVQSAAAQAKPG